MAGMAECGIRDLWVWQGLGVELSGNIISNYRTFKCERSERTYNFDYVRRKRTGAMSNEINMTIQTIII